MRLLSVDFDFFTPRKLERSQGPDWGLYDWGGSDSPLMISNVMWIARASAFTRLGYPRPTTSGEEKTFWDRVTLKPNAPLFYADSHLWITLSDVVGQPPVTEIVSLDAHADCGGYEGTPDWETYIAKGHVTAENWGVYLATQKAKIEVRYPRWLPNPFDHEPEPLVDIWRGTDDGQHLGEFDCVYVCRSGGWVPSWVEEDFWAFLDAAPTERRFKLDGIERLQWGEYEEGVVRQMAEAERGIFEQLAEANSKAQAAQQ